MTPEAYRSIRTPPARQASWELPWNPSRFFK